VWTFYEGPPTANGRPGTHHVEARVFKDVFPRYRTMKGASVRRKGGWDCHGLPVELEVERELGLDSKADIEAYGIEAFNARCRESVGRYVGAFERLTERIAFWVDMDDAYRTMDPEYVDSLWWGLSQLWDRDLIFEDFRVAPYCGRCGTALSDAEVAQGYQETEDPSVFVRFPVLDGPLAERGAALVVWTTTPWTLPSNTACAVGPDVRYALARRSGDEQLLVLALDLVEPVLGEAAEVVEELAADDLVGLHYEGPFDWAQPAAGQAGEQPDWRYVVAADFVTTTDGSGIVHLAPAFGADDMAVGRREGLPVVNPVGPDARFTTGPWAGRVRQGRRPAIQADLDERGLLLSATSYRHTYPFCWRCKRPLIYWAKPSWYIRTTAVRDQLLANNATIDWHPEHIRDGRFGRWLENNVDWALSRDRYWGTPAAVLAVRRRRRLRPRHGGLVPRAPLGAHRRGPSRARSAPPVRGRRHRPLRELRRHGAPRPGRGRRLVRLRRDAVRPVGLPAHGASRSSRSTTPPTTSARPSTRPEAGSTRCSRSRRCCSGTAPTAPASASATSWTRTGARCPSPPATSSTPTSSSNGTGPTRCGG
jgi:isoleucyl-tRNA synthetase